MVAVEIRSFNPQMGYINKLLEDGSINISNRMVITMSVAPKHLYGCINDIQRLYSHELDAAKVGIVGIEMALALTGARRLYTDVNINALVQLNLAYEDSDNGDTEDYTYKETRRTKLDYIGGGVHSETRNGFGFCCTPGTDQTLSNISRDTRISKPNLMCMAMINALIPFLEKSDRQPRKNHLEGIKKEYENFIKQIQHIIIIRRIDTEPFSYDAVKGVLKFQSEIGNGYGSSTLQNIEESEKQISNIDATKYIPSNNKENDISKQDSSTILPNVEPKNQFYSSTGDTFTKYIIEESTEKPIEIEPEIKDEDKAIMDYFRTIFVSGRNGAEDKMIAYAIDALKADKNITITKKECKSLFKALDKVGW